MIVVEADDVTDTGSGTTPEITDGAEPQKTAPGRRLRSEPLQAHRSYETGLRGDAEAFALYEEPDYTIDEELLDAVYTEILEHCSLIDPHRDYLKTRGVSAMTAHRGRIGSITRRRARSLKNHLLDRFSEEDLLRVPGFSRRRLGRLSFTLSGEYLLIPYHDADHNITTIEGRAVGEPPKGMGKYVSLRGSGNHLYVFPEFMPERLEAFCEGPLGSIVAAHSGIAVGAIQGVRRHRHSQTGGSLPELEGTDFTGRRIPYIPDVDVKPAAIADVKAEIPKACTNLIAAHNGIPQVALLPEGKDLDEWLLTKKASERRPAFTSFVAGAVSLQRYLEAADPTTRQAPQKNGAELAAQTADQPDSPKHRANPSTPGPLYEPLKTPEEATQETTAPVNPVESAPQESSLSAPAASDGTASLGKVLGALVRMSSLQQRDIDLMGRFGIPEQIAREAGIGSMSKVRAEDIASKLAKSMGARGARRARRLQRRRRRADPTRHVRRLLSHTPPGRPRQHYRDTGYTGIRGFKGTVRRPGAQDPRPGPAGRPSLHPRGTAGETGGHHNQRGRGAPAGHLRYPGGLYPQGRSLLSRGRGTSNVGARRGGLWRA